MHELSNDAKRNRARWTKVNADFTDEQASKSWTAAEMTWGVFGVPEASVNTLGDVNGLDVVELGCGTAYVSAWLARTAASRQIGTRGRPSGMAVSCH
jgi:ubiquinone/menaquinone biosynthesis C-methylase UbiE